jgi:serine/threonine protein kinase
VGAQQYCEEGAYHHKLQADAEDAELTRMMDVTETVTNSPNKTITSSETMTIGVSDSTHISQERQYIISKIIGKGAFSKVHLAYKIENGYRKRIACKDINKEKISELTLYKFLPREMSIIKTLVHPHIITVYDTMDIHGHAYIFMEICEEGTLFEYIYNGGPLKACKAQHLFR